MLTYTQSLRHECARLSVLMESLPPFGDDWNECAARRRRVLFDIFDMYPCVRDWLSRDPVSVICMM